MDRSDLKPPSNYRVYNHDEGARIAINSMLQKIRSSSEWRSSFLDGDITKALCKRTKPAPDGRFYSGNTKCHVAIEYKPPYSDLDEIGKGFNQCFDYITDTDHTGQFLNQASLLVIPQKNEQGNDIESLYINKFRNTVFNRNPIALVTYSPEDPSNVSLISNFGPSLRPASELKQSYGNNMIKYWASWRENYPSYNYSLLKTASEYKGQYSSEATKKIWDDFYFKYYCYPENTMETVDLIPNKLTVWGDKKQIWQESIKKALKKAINEGAITEEEAINRIQWAAANSPEDRTRIGRKIENIKVKKPAKISADNDYADRKKNSTNFFNHVGLWDPVTWEVSDLGYKFLNQIDQGADPFDEMVTLALVPGKWMELIQDIKRAQNLITHSNVKNYRIELQKIFKENGNIGFNPGRKSTGTRNFLQSEQQILGRAGILIKPGNSTSYYHRGLGWVIDEEILDLYTSNFYANYPDAAWAA